MFYALTQGLLDTSGLRIEHVLRDIQTLNEAAFQGIYEISALSFHAYAYLGERYELMPSGASFGDGYGPVLVAQMPTTREDLRGGRIAVPGRLTTAHMVLRLWLSEFEPVWTPFDRILEVVRKGEVDGGVVIHEGQLTFADEGLFPVVDLGAWWKQDTGMPLPLGGNGIRRDIDRETTRRLCRLLSQSINYGLDHRSEALDYAIRYARELEEDRERSDKFVGMYVNDWTRDYGETGKKAVQMLLDRGFDAGLLPRRVKARWVEMEDPVEAPA